MSRKNLSRTERIDVRASNSVKLLLQEAARACHKNVSEFLLDAGVLAAHQVLAQRVTERGTNLVPNKPPALIQ